MGEGPCRAQLQAAAPSCLTFLLVMSLRSMSTCSSGQTQGSGEASCEGDKRAHQCSHCPSRPSTVLLGPTSPLDTQLGLWSQA